MSLLNAFKTALAQFATTDGVQATDIAGLSVIRISQPSQPMATVITPALCIVAQGRKRVVAGDRVLAYDAENFLVVSVDTPAVGQVIEASEDAPYLCIRLELDAAEIAALLIDVGGLGAAAGDAEPSLAVSHVTDDLLEPAIRLVNLLGRPDDIAVLAPMYRREILYRLLRSDQATKLQQIAVAESLRLQQVNRAIGWIKSNYRVGFAIETLAAEARMSPSALHLHFKAVTAMSPLQYQKQLRLQEARRMMLTDAVDAATAGHRVGYDSPSQFSREYARVFGAPPLRDVARLKAGDLQSAG